MIFCTFFIFIKLILVQILKENFHIHMFATIFILFLLKVSEGLKWGPKVGKITLKVF
jgi:hypothetical protein